MLFVLCGDLWLLHAGLFARFIRLNILLLCLGVMTSSLEKRELFV